MRVLGVVTDNDRRGAQVFGTELGRKLAELGFESRTVALAPGTAGGLDLDFMGDRPRSAPTLRALRRAMAAADVTIAHGSTTLTACALASAGPGMPFVYRQISDPVYWTPTRFKRLRTAFAYRFPSQVVSLSEQTARVLVDRFRVPSRRITVIPNGVDERRFTAATDADRVAARVALGLRGDLPMVGYVGSLEREKGLDDLLCVTDERWRVVIAGEGPFRAAIRAQAEKRKLNVDLIGLTEDPRAVYAAADLIVLPSWTEMQPAVLIEASMTGTPCVATAVGDVPNIVADGVTGRLVPPHNPGDLREALESVLADSGRRASMGAAAREHVLSRFSLSVVGARWAELLATVPG